MSPESTRADAPVLIVPYMWIGDFVRCHSVVTLLRRAAPERPVDLLASSLCAPLADYMPGVRRAIVFDLPRGRLALAKQRALAAQLRAQHYGQAIVMLRTWKSALAPFLAGIPVRTGFTGELRYGLLNDLRSGERAHARMIDQMGALALARNAALPSEWPLPQLVVPPAEIAAWRARNKLENDGAPVVAFAPGAVGAGKAWPVEHYAALARELTAQGMAVWVIGGPNETPLAAQIAGTGGGRVHDLTGSDLRNAVLALGAATAAVTNDSGLMHVAAAIGAPTVAIFGPTSPWHWKPLNPVSAILEPPGDDDIARARAVGNDGVRHRRTDDGPLAAVTDAVHRALSA
jgi:heptosyltransferase-2